MIRLLIIAFLFLSSLLVIFRAPTNLLWYVSILMTEFCWLFIGAVVILLFWKTGSTAYQLIGTIAGIITICIFLVPIIQAYGLSRKIEKQFSMAFPGINESAPPPFQLTKMITGIGAPKVKAKTLFYDQQHHLALDFYPSEKTGVRPCIVVIHGGSWAAGDSKQLAELNSELAKEGYHVASITYRLAPRHNYPAPIEDVKSAIAYLDQNAASLLIDTGQYVLLGRSAGGQIALTAAYTLHDPTIKGVIDFYGPTDMVWGYENPTNPLVLDSRKIMEDYLGGTLTQKQDQYIHSSATETVTTKTPPTLMIYGENDPLVSPRHGTRLSVKLIEKGIPFFELYLPWGTHGFDYTLNGPGGQLSTWAVKRFLQWIFSGRNNHYRLNSK